MSKILFIDIETSAVVGEAWGKYEQNLLHIIEDWKLLSCAYKWHKKGKIECLALPDFKNEKALVVAVWKLLCEADIVVAHYGDKFDIKKLNAKFLEYNLGPPTPFKTVDTKKEATRRFKFTGNSLNDLARLFGLPEKINTGGYSLWRGCKEGNPASWKKMIGYNKHDVLLLWKIYEFMLGWMDKHPPTRPNACPKCGSKRLKSNGWKHTKVNSYRRFRCLGCRGYCHSIRKDKTMPKNTIGNGG